MISAYACLNCGEYATPLEQVCSKCGGIVVYVGDSDHE